MTIGSHQETIGRSQDWITPRHIIDALGPFDLDPCASTPRPWDCAVDNISLPVDGLATEWWGRVWLNPPFDRRVVGRWIAKLAAHPGGGIALIHARTETEWFRPIWDHARAILFLADRLTFHRPDGTKATANSGAPVCLVAFTAADAGVLLRSGLAGSLVTVWQRIE